MLYSSFSGEGSTRVPSPPRFACTQTSAIGPLEDRTISLFKVGLNPSRTCRSLCNLTGRIAEPQNRTLAQLQRKWSFVREVEFPVASREWPPYGLRPVQPFVRSFASHSRFLSSNPSVRQFQSSWQPKLRHYKHTFLLFPSAFADLLLSADCLCFPDLDGHRADAVGFPAPLPIETFGGRAIFKPVPS